MNWIRFKKINGSDLYLRICDIYKVVRVKGTGLLHVYTVQGITYQCDGMNDSILRTLLEDENAE